MSQLGLLELVRVGGVDGGFLGEDEALLFDGELHVGFDVELFGFFEGLLFDEGDHFFEFGGDLAGGGGGLAWWKRGVRGLEVPRHRLESGS